MKELEFKAQLAHDGSVTKKISDFHNVKELYQRLAEAFTIPKNEVRVFVSHATSNVDHDPFRSSSAHSTPIPSTWTIFWEANLA